MSEEPYNCWVCGKTCKEAGGMRFYKGKWWCDGSRSSCWKENFEEDDELIVRVMVKVRCPFCKTEHVFNVRGIEGTCSCGAEFHEGYEEMVRFIRRKTRNDERGR